MAESSGEKTEMPTPKKLRDARQKGQVCTSKDIVSTAILVVLFALLAWMGVALMEDMEQLLRFLGGGIEHNGVGDVMESSKLTIIYILKHSFIFVLVAAIIGIVGNVGKSWMCECVNGNLVVFVKLFYFIGRNLVTHSCHALVCG